MGMFFNENSNRFANYDIQPATGYEGNVGLSRIMIESASNDLALFGGLLNADHREMTVNESTTAEELAAITEATGIGFIDKIVEFIKRIIAKIKGLFNSFIAKLDSLIIKDNKKFVEKYKDAVMRKTYGEDFKYKFRKTKTDLAAAAVALTGRSEKIAVNHSYEELMRKDVKALEKEYDDLTESEMSDLAYEKKSREEYVKDSFDEIFADEDEYEKLSTGELSEVISVLCESKKTTDAADKASKKIEKFFTDKLRDIDSARSKVNAIAAPSSKEEKKVDLSKVPGGIGKEHVSKNGTVSHGTGNYSYNSEDAQKSSKALGLMYKQVRINEMTETTAAEIVVSAIKFHIKQCRSLFARAAAYNPKKVNEGAWLDAVAESTTLVIDQELDGIYV